MKASAQELDSILNSSFPTHILRIYFSGFSSPFLPSEAHLTVLKFVHSETCNKRTPYLVEK